VNARLELIKMAFTLRRATVNDADEIGNVYSASFRLLTFLPTLHTTDKYRWFIANVILKECELTIAEDETGIVAFLALRGEEVRLLYTRPDRIGMGAGTQLIDAAKAGAIGALELWCFQANERARRFYEARGFHAIRFTDGAENEERTPDVRYQWERYGGAVIIRDAKHADSEAIHELVAAAFGRPDEAVLLDRLRSHGACAISLVAVEGDEIVGQVLFSRMTAPFRALGLGPVSVKPNRQRRGIGSRLIRTGLNRGREAGWQGAFVLGDPKFYSRFGFDPDLADGFICCHSGPHLMALALGRELPNREGVIEYPSAFD
jgi:putative acetyltransferase